MQCVNGWIDRWLYLIARKPTKERYAICSRCKEHLQRTIHSQLLTVREFPSSVFRLAMDTNKTMILYGGKETMFLPCGKETMFLPSGKEAMFLPCGKEYVPAMW